MSTSTLTRPTTRLRRKRGRLFAAGVATLAIIAMALDTILFADFDDLRAARIAQDRDIADFIATLTDDVIASDLTYQSVTAGAYTMPRDLVLGHMFNHQTHHRGQVSNMVLEAGGKALEIDLIYYGREQL